MTTVGQQIMERLEALENTMTELQLNQQAPIAPGARRDAEQFRNNLRDEMATLQEYVKASGHWDMSKVADMDHTLIREIIR